MAGRAGGKGSVRELTNDMLTGAYPEAAPRELEREVESASLEVTRLDEISDELDRMASYAAHGRDGGAERSDRDQEDIEQYVPAAVAGDDVSRTRLLARINPLVLRYCRARLNADRGNAVDPDDVAQEVCVAMLSALPSYRRGSSFLAFVYGIAGHKVTDAFRAVGRNRSDPVADLPDGPATADGPESRVLAAEMSERIGSRLAPMLGLLPDRQREVIILRIVVGLSVKETAEILHMTPGAVRVAQHRGLGRLRRLGALDDLASSPGH